MAVVKPARPTEQDDPPQRQVRRLLGRARRKLLRVRAAEAAAICATAAALSAAAVQAGWAMAHFYLPPAVFLCLLPAAAGAVLLLCPAAGRRVGVTGPAGQASGVVCLLVGLAAAPAVLLDAHLHVAAWMIPAALIPAGAVAGALVSLIRKPDLRRSAISLDSRARLRDRLATAAELIESPVRDETVVRGVCLHALRAAEEAGAARTPLWSRGRSTAAALALAVLLSATLIPVVSAAGQREVSAVVSAGRRMTAAEREQLAEAIRRAAAEAGLDEHSPDVDEAADSARDADAYRLQQALINLRRAGVDVSALERRDPPVDEPPTVVTDDTDVADAAPTPGEGVVRVYSPGPASDDEADAPTEPFEQAWSRARLQAAEALAAGRIPQRYRPLVRRYFEDE